MGLLEKVIFVAVVCVRDFPAAFPGAACGIKSHEADKGAPFRFQRLFRPCFRAGRFFR